MGREATNERPAKAKVGLPAAKGGVVKADEDEILKSDMSFTNEPLLVGLLVDASARSFEEAFDALCDIFSQFGDGDRARWAAEVLGGYLTAPTPVVWPLEADRDTGSSTFEHWLVSVFEILGSGEESVAEGDAEDALWV